VSIGLRERFKPLVKNVSTCRQSVSLTPRVALLDATAHMIRACSWYRRPTRVILYSPARGLLFYCLPWGYQNHCVDPDAPFHRSKMQDADRSAQGTDRSCHQCADPKKDAGLSHRCPEKALFAMTREPGTRPYYAVTRARPFFGGKLVDGFRLISGPGESFRVLEGGKEKKRRFSRTSRTSWCRPYDFPRRMDGTIRKLQCRVRYRREHSVHGSECARRDGA